MSCSNRDPRSACRGCRSPWVACVLGLVCALLLLAPASLARADILHVYGPEGNATERRVLAVLEGADGRCASWEDIDVRAGPGTEVEFGPSAGACAHWLTIRSEVPRDQVILRAYRPGGQALATVAMGSERGLEVDVHRTGRRLRVTVGGVPEGERVSVTATWDGGHVELDPAGRAFVGTVPARVVVGVVARSGTMTGAGVAAPEGDGSPVVLILPSQLAVPAGGAARAAAFLIVTDRRGRPSQNVPLSITSDGGRLRSLAWIEPGLATVTLSAPPDSVQVDLAVSVAGGGSVRVDLPVASSWPTGATLEAPDAVRPGKAFQVRVGVRTMTDVPYDASLVRVLCGGAVRIPDDSGAVSCRATSSGEVAIVVYAMVDGRPVPMAAGAVEVLAVTEVPPPSLPPQSTLGPLVVGAFVHGGVDTWSHGAAGAGASLRWSAWSHGSVGARLRFSTAGLSAAPRAPVIQRLRGVRHALDMMVGGQLFTRVGDVELFASLHGGPAFGYTDAQVGDQDASGAAWRPTASLALGARWHLGPWLVGASAGTRATWSLDESTWDEAPARVYLEVGVETAL